MLYGIPAALLIYKTFATYGFKGGLAALASGTAVLLGLCRIMDIPAIHHLINRNIGVLFPVVAIATLVAALFAGMVAGEFASGRLRGGRSR